MPAEPEPEDYAPPKPFPCGGVNQPPCPPEPATKQPAEPTKPAVHPKGDDGPVPDHSNTDTDRTR